MARRIKHPNGAKAKNGDLCSQINVDHFSDLSQEEQASSINSAFLEPLEEYEFPALLEHLPQEDILEILRVSEESIQRTLPKVNPTKAIGLDTILNWLLMEFADILAFPITEILNVSYSQQRLPSVWKMANVSPVTKK